MRTENQSARKSIREPLTISLWIDSYNDLFSDFDPRPYGQRMLSDDFVAHARKVSKDGKGKVEVVRLLVPRALRVEESEKVIKQRLQEHFHITREQLRVDAVAHRRKGSYFIVCGVLLMLLSGYIAYLELSGFYGHVLQALVEPGGWFLLWSGLDHFILLSKHRKNELDFYERWASASVEFDSY